MDDINKEDKKPANNKIDKTATNKRITNKTTTSTPYDDVFRTLLNDCSSLIIPVINEVFSEL